MNHDDDMRPMSVGDWMLVLLVLVIPVVNVVMYLVWGLGGTGNVNRRNFCLASIYWFLIILALGAVILCFHGVVGGFARRW